MYVSPIANDILAGHLINYGAVSFMTDSPMRLKSGLVTPIYVDNRSLTAHPDAWRDIIETMCSRIAQLGLKFDIIAGVEGAGVSHAAALAYRLGKPSIFVRQRPKTYGDHSRVEGSSVKGKRILIIEDHISTGLHCSRPSKASRPKKGLWRTASPSRPSGSMKRSSSSRTRRLSATNCSTSRWFSTRPLKSARLIRRSAKS